MGKVFFIADTHFEHKNILKLEPTRIEAVAKFMLKNKKFKTLEDATDWINYCLQNDVSINELMYWHDKMLISNWNKVVTNDDIVWLLGDYSFANKQKTIQITNKLNGHKKMIIGNHDKLGRKFYEHAGFEYVSDLPVVVKDFFILSHAPSAYINGNCAFFNIHGHVHTDARCKTHSSNSQCVCVERQNFKPIEIKEFNNAD